jgi:hypothetical protein
MAKIIKLGQPKKPEEKPIRTLEDFAKLVPALLAKEGIEAKPKEDTRPLAVVTNLATMRSAASAGALKVKKEEGEQAPPAETKPFPGRKK